MADIIYQGGMLAMREGDLDGTPDIRLILVMSDTTADTEVDILTVSDFSTLDEFDGVGYVEIDCANVLWAYDSPTAEYRLDFDDAFFNVPPATVAPASRDAVGLVLYLFVDGTEANDIPIAFTDSGGFPFNATNGDINFAVHADGFLFLRQA